MADAPVNPLIRRRRIIERPRLVTALDRSRARVRMLVAPAGYGKTILAEQWAAREGMRVSWFRARPSAADIAVLARALAAAGAEIVPGCERRLSERLTATLDPSGDVTVLAEMLAEDLASWPDDAWIAIDDYHHVCSSTTCESFVETLVQHAPIRLLISTRQRPAWVSTRSILYGEVLEIGQSGLAMREDEVAEVLAGARDGMSSGLVALAGGWPAVIGLANLTSSPVETDAALPEQLYQFFADEVYRSLDPDVRAGLLILAIAPSLDRKLAIQLLGADGAKKIYEHASSLGILEEHDDRVAFHPLAFAFLNAKLSVDLASSTSSFAAQIARYYREIRDWDAAFDVIATYDTSGLDDLIGEALDEMLNAGRLATLADWISLASARSEGSRLKLAEAEVALRHGLHMKAQSDAMFVTSEPDVHPETRFRALDIAGRAAHTGSREEEALAFYRAAAQEAPDIRSERRAKWGQLMCATALELDEAHDLLRELEVSVSRADALELVRLADRRLSLGFRFGFIQHMSEARNVAELVPGLHDPFARSSFRSTYTWALLLGGYYADARDQALAWLDDATIFRVDVALSHAHAMLGYAFAGLRNYADAHVHLDIAARMARRFNDEFAVQNEYALRVRTLLQQGLPADACALEPPALHDDLKGVGGEVIASRALALACLGRADEALELGRLAKSRTKAIETRVLCPAIECVVALKLRSPQLAHLADTLVREAFDSGAVDLLVVSYRSSPALLPVLLRSSLSTERAIYALSRVGDGALVQELGLSMHESLDPRSKLSRRERQVYDLICDGLSNYEIGRALFITESTAKVHVHHIFDKLGIRSRTALALEAARLRTRQATSAAGPAAEIGREPP